MATSTDPLENRGERRCRERRSAGRRAGDGAPFAPWDPYDTKAPAHAELFTALEASEQQRTHLAEALHDSVLQTLLSASRDLREVFAGGSVEKTPGTEASIRRASQLVDASIKQIRATARDLSQCVPSGLLLCDAVELLVDEAAKRGAFACEVSVDGEAAIADPDVALWIIRELLTNVVKHARASHVSVAVRPVPQGVCIVVLDDGIGASPESMRRAVLDGHIGLALVTARVQRLRGSLSIGPADGHGLDPRGGTRVTVLLPTDSPE